jgi:hypothetical protein
MTMTNNDLRDLCLELLRAESQDSVIALLKQAGYWDNAECWRLYGDSEGNFATIGNQQSRPDAALAEKLVNSVDARLLNECLTRGVSPQSGDAPQSIRRAVSRYFEDRSQSSEDLGGELHAWATAKLSREAQHITLVATGRRSRPCLTIADRGEGQTPDHMPTTFLSIDKKNKLRIPFVQGKFNMGGTGALMFCGEHALQLIITRRNPAIISAMREKDPSADEWGFTVTRRERPLHGAGEVRNSVFKYLAPVGADIAPMRGGVLRFKADTLPLFPADNKPYVREASWGSALKLYEYDMKGFSSHILMGDGLLHRLEILLPGIALPVRMHECRDYEGKPASFATSLIGLTNRLEVNRGGNIEEGYPTSVPFTAGGEMMTARIYAFQRGKAETYRTNEGAVFSINGQTHGTIPKSIFARRRVGMGRLGDSLLVTVDCSNISVGAREDLFKNSRDRLSNGELRKAIERELEEILNKHPGLRKLRDERRRTEVAKKLEDAKPLKEVLKSILKSSPSLASLLLTGQRLGNPHKPAATGTTETDKTGGPTAGSAPFVGKKHPTLFRFHGRTYGDLLERNCELGRRSRLRFETDVENQYFSRQQNPGSYAVELQVEGGTKAVTVDSSLTLHDGFAHWSIELPDAVKVGDVLTAVCTVNDDVLLDPFVNIARLTIKEQGKRASGGNGKRRKKQGTGTQQGAAPEAGLQDPMIYRVAQSEWAKHSFDKHSACKVIQDYASLGDDDEPDPTFYVNVDNIYLRTDMKTATQDPKVMEDKFVYANVLVGLALLQQEVEAEKQHPAVQDDATDGRSTVEERVLQTTQALAPFLLPMIDQLGNLASAEVDESLGEAGDNE